MTEKTNSLPPHPQKDSSHNDLQQPVVLQPLSPEAPSVFASTGEKTDIAMDALAKAHAPEKKPKRTLGLRLFDIGLYPLLSNFAVFAVSVVATFLTERGGDRKNGKLIYGKLGKWAQKRGAWMEEQFQSIGLNQEGAKMGKIVFFSFADGTLMAPLVKLLEDRREKIAYWLDDKLGTKPPDMTPYNAEPKQSWGSVVGGRLATALIVVPTAVVLNKPNALSRKLFKSDESLNAIFFSNPSVRHAEKFTGLKQSFGKLMEKLTGVAPDSDISIPVIRGSTLTTETAKQGETIFKTLAKMTYFEAFYTSVCTAGLYISSRLLARNFEKKSEEVAGQTTAQNTTPKAALPPAHTSFQNAVTNKHKETRAQPSASVLGQHPSFAEREIHKTPIEPTLSI